MKQLNVNKVACIGCCRCVDFAPAIFDVKDGKAVVKKQPSAGQVSQANLAVENCPVEAINWEA